MKRIALSVKIFLRILIVLIIGQIVYGVVYFRDVYREKLHQIANQKVLVEQIIRQNMKTTHRIALLTLESIVNDSDIQEAMYLRQRYRLLSLTRDLWQKLKERGIAQFQFHIPPAVSFLRLHNIEQYGDDLSRNRKMVVVCNRDKKPVVGFELGKGGWGYRVILPIFYEQQHVGSVELGFKVGKDMLDEFRSVLGGRWAIWNLVRITSSGEREWLAKPKPVAWTDESIIENSPWYFSPENLRRLRRGEIISKFQKSNESIEVVVPVKDYSGEVGFVFVQRKHSNIRQVVRGVILKTLFISILLLIVMSVVSLWYISSSLKPVVKITDMINEISSGEGDLTKKIELDTNDEIGDLARGFNTFVEKQHSMIYEIKSRVVSLLEIVETLVRKMKEIDDTSTEQNDHVSRVVTAVEEMNSTITEIANNADSVAQYSNEASKKAHSGSEVVEKTINGMNVISEVVERAANCIHRLGERSAQIGEIISVIDDIADQTNLLALNAAIEAARAGEHGRGFAVVADEVRKLAERTSQATREVAKTIQTIQEETQEAVVAMDESRKEVEKGKELAKSSGEALQEIERSTDTVTNMIGQIASATREQSNAIDEITKSIEGISFLSKKLTEISSSSRGLVEDFMCGVNEIKGQIDRFKL